MHTSLPMLIVTIPFVAFWSVGCAAVGAGVCALARRCKRGIADSIADSAASVERSAAIISASRAAGEAFDARQIALDEVVADLAASKWPDIGDTSEARYEAIRRRVDEKLAAKSGGSKDVGPVPIDPGVAGPNVGPVPIDPGVKAPRTWADVRRDQLEVAEEVNAMPKPDGWDTMSADERTAWKIPQERARLDAREEARLAK